MTESVTYPPGTSNIVYTPVPGPVGPVGPVGPPGTSMTVGPGTAAAPSITFAADTNTGLYNRNPDELGFATGGADRLMLNAAGAVLPGLLAVGTGTAMDSGGAALRGAHQLEIAEGTVASPVTTGGPVMRISRVSAQTQASTGTNSYNADATAAFMVSNYQTGSTDIQPIAIWGTTRRDAGSMDALALQAIAITEASATGRAIGGYLAATRSVATAKANGAEVRVYNNTTTDGAYNTVGASDTMALWLTTSSSSNTASAEALGIMGLSCQFINGLSFKPASIRDTSIHDMSSSTVSINIAGAHDTGIKLNDATLNIAVLLPNGVPISGRNAANSANFRALSVGADNRVQLGDAGAAGMTFIAGTTNAIEQRNGVSAQALRIYNTTDAGTANYERGVFQWGGSVFQIGTEQAGTGVARSVYFTPGGTTRWIMLTTGTLLAGSDNVCDIGNAGATGRPKDLYLAGRVIAGGNPVFNGAAAVAKQTVSGSRGANAALASLLTALSTIGLVTDSSTV